MSNGRQHQALQVIRYGDLGASVYPSGVPARVADELVTQYRTFRATIDCFLLWDGVQPTGVCILEEPHHLLVFHAWRSDTLEILNKGIEIEPAAVSHACRALFRALPAVREYRVEVPFQARELDLPTIVGGETEYMIAELPATFDEYLSSLGTSTRRNLRLYENRLSRAFPGFTSDTLVRGMPSRRPPISSSAGRTSASRSTGAARTGRPILTSTLTSSNWSTGAGKHAS